MTDEDSELLQVKIRHRGQCPKENGHCGGAMASVAVFTFFLTFFVVTFLFTLIDKSAEMKAEAVKRGYAIHDPMTGKWRWR